MTPEEAHKIADRAYLRAVSEQDQRIEKMAEWLLGNFAGMRRIAEVLKGGPDDVRSMDGPDIDALLSFARIGFQQVLIVKGASPTATDGH